MNEVLIPCVALFISLALFHYDGDNNDHTAIQNGDHECFCIVGLFDSEFLLLQKGDQRSDCKCDCNSDCKCDCNSDCKCDCDSV